MSTMPEYDQFRVQNLDRKRKLAEALKQTQMPQGQMVGGVYVAPSITQYLASGLQQYQGNKQIRDIDQQQEKILTDRQRTMSDASKRLSDALKPRTQETMQGGMPVMEERQPSPDEMMQAQLEYAQMTQDPQAMNQLLSQRMQYQLGQQARQDDREFRSAEAEANREQRMLELQMKMEDSRISRAEQFEARKELAQMVAANRQQPQPYFQAVPTAQGYARFNARTGQMEPIDMGNGSVLPAAQDPSLQADLTTAKEQAKSDVEAGTDKRKAVKKADQLLSTITEAESLLKKKPTGSYAGTARDAFARGVGMTTEAGKTASELETLAGWMVANVPRMEGPQSNFDVQNYQTMAAKVGDRTVPVAERQAALKTLRNLQEKYKALNQGEASQPASPSKVKRFNPKTGRIE